MCGVPFFPIPLCFQCGTDRNPCHCRVIGPSVGMSFFFLLSLAVPTRYMPGTYFLPAGRSYI